jgi:hypothetical protein
MRLALDAGASRVLVDLRAAGPLAVLGHDPTLTARPAPLSVEVEVGEGGATQASIDARFPVDAIEPPADIPAADRAKMRENMRSREVLDAARHPAIELRARYAGMLDEGTLAGDLVVRGTPRAFTMGVRVVRDGDAYTVSGRWEGRLTDLGIKPFKAMLGALKLEDRVVLRLEARFRP